MLIHIAFAGRGVPSLLQQALKPNAHEHYVELRLRTYRLFVLQTRAYSHPIFVVAEKQAGAITLSNAILQRKR